VGFESAAFGRLSGGIVKSLYERLDVKAALDLAERHMKEKHRIQKQAKEDWDMLQGRIAELLAENAQLKERIAALEAKDHAI
jgi:chromosome segregation ATPase